MSTTNVLSFRSYTTILIALVILGTTGCDNTITPYSDRATYSIWGYLSLSRSTQFVRVKDLRQPLSSDPTDLPNLTVTLKNLSTETTTILEDTVIFFEDEGSRVATQNFRTELSVSPDTRYQITVEDPSGTITQATTKTPSPVTPVADPDTGNCLTNYTIEFPGVKEKRRIANAQVQLVLDGETVRFSEEENSPVFLRNPESSPDHDNAFLTFEPEELLLRRLESVDNPNTFCVYESLCPALTTPDEDDDVPDDRPGGSPIPPDDEDSPYKNIAISYTHVGPEWHGPLSEADSLSDPQETATVSNGRGLFGSLQRNQVLAKVDTMRDIPVDGPDIVPCDNG